MLSHFFIWWMFISLFSMNSFLECYDSNCLRTFLFVQNCNVSIHSLHFFTLLWFFVWFILQFLRNLHLPKNIWMIKWYLFCTQTNYMVSYLLSYFDIYYVRIFKSYLVFVSWPRDHSYITSSHFWDFCSMFLVLRISKNWHLLTPPPPYKCWRNIWMVP